MKIKILASGSKGNCYIIKSPTGTLIIEAGIKYKDILQGLNFHLDDVVGALVSHAHLDHSKSAKDLMGAGIDIYSNAETFQALNLTGHRTNIIEPLKQLYIGDFKVIGFPIEHDVPGLGYLIQYAPTGERLLFLTDSYYSKYKFKGLNYILIECNYIKETLDANIENGYIDQAMKPRLLQSHFSLENVKGFLKTNDLSECREIILLHLSDRNSDANQMIREIEELTGITPKVADKGLTLELNMFPY
ncbi:phosphoribosyl 1,2-cyclic phosphodiesterase [Tissierella praeacuta]|uniref:MBL fold metallo-hydrolase n=1 Tax=Tissierella praeacuta TaxID=43131 RepID=UPI00104E3C27|nr:MBL fold metallo-hydrolase [Tissierella praeacuta]TCU72902.1 phosphoribosyl 1,2-cyclic phosphodiesterase [Tissierella praeacuta]